MRSEATKDPVLTHGVASSPAAPRNDRSMTRPIKRRLIRFNPDITYFKPRAVPLRDLEEINLTRDELEAIRLCDFNDLDQHEAAQKMKISQSTLQRILSTAHQKTAEALIKGKAIKITKVNEGK